MWLQFEYQLLQIFQRIFHGVKPAINLQQNSHMVLIFPYGFYSEDTLRVTRSGSETCEYTLILLFFWCACGPQGQEDLVASTSPISVPYKYSILYFSSFILFFRNQKHQDEYHRLLYCAWHGRAALNNEVSQSSSYVHK